VKTVCMECGAALEIGDYPFCPHGSIYEQNAQKFDPIVVHRNPDGSYSFPASHDAPVRAGCEKVEIRTLREADRITREVNAREDSQIREQHAHEQSNRDQNRRRNRADLDRLMAGGMWKNREGQVRHGMSAEGREFAARMREYVDSKPRTRPGSANFHIDVFANDSSNREAHADARTNWKSRKG